MTDHDLLAAVDAALAEPVHVIEHAVAPGLVLELTYDGYGIVSATWRCGAWGRVAEVGEG